MNNRKHITEKILARANKEIAKERYKTTSFTMLKDRMQLFFDICEKLNVRSSEVLRAMVEEFISENNEDIKECSCGGVISSESGKLGYMTCDKCQMNFAKQYAKEKNDEQ